MQYAGALDDPAITETPQFCGGIHVTRKCPLSVEFVGKWYELCHEHFNLITDEPSVLPNLAGFRENRWDQSAFSVLLKPYKPCIVDAGETWTDGFYDHDLKHTPFWATRLRTADATLPTYTPVRGLVVKVRRLVKQTQRRITHPKRTAHNALKRIARLLGRGS